MGKVKELRDNPDRPVAPTRVFGAVAVPLSVLTMLFSEGDDDESIEEEHDSDNYEDEEPYQECYINATDPFVDHAWVKWEDPIANPATLQLTLTIFCADPEELRNITSTFLDADTGNFSFSSEQDGDSGNRHLLTGEQYQQVDSTMVYYIGYLPGVEATELDSGSMPSEWSVDSTVTFDNLPIINCKYNNGNTDECCTESKYAHLNSRCSDRPELEKFLTRKYEGWKKGKKISKVWMKPGQALRFLEVKKGKFLGKTIAVADCKFDLEVRYAESYSFDEFYEIQLNTGKRKYIMQYTETPAPTPTLAPTTQAPTYTGFDQVTGTGDDHTLRVEQQAEAGHHTPENHQAYHEAGSTTPYNHSPRPTQSLYGIGRK